MEDSPPRSRLQKVLEYTILLPIAVLAWGLSRLFPLLVLGLAALMAIGMLAFFGAWPPYWPGAIGLTILLGWGSWVWYTRKPEVRAQTSEAATILIKCAMHILLLRGGAQLWNEPKNSASFVAIVVGTFSAVLIHVGHKATMKDFESNEADSDETELTGLSKQ